MRNALMTQFGVLSGCHHHLLPSSKRVGARTNFSWGRSNNKNSKRGSRKTRNSNNHRNTKLSQSSRNWLKRQEKDGYTKRARAEGSPSRSIFKLEEILTFVKNQSRNRRKEDNINFLNAGDIVVDLGAAPGGWSLFSSKKIGRKGCLIAVDLLPLDTGVVRAIELSIGNTRFHAIEGDFRHVKEDLNEILISCNNNKLGNDEKCNTNYSQVDCIISDMAANTTGDKLTDALQTMSLCEDAMMLAAGSSCFEEFHEETNDVGLLRKGGSFLCKFFACGKENEQDLMTAAKTRFKYTTVVKPPASRKESAELYLFATGYSAMR